MVRSSKPPANIVLEGEDWEPIPGYQYMVSSQGRIWSPHGKGRILRAHKKPPDNYLCAGLCRSGKSRNFYVHLLVIRAFSGPPPDGHECRHLDGVRTNNAISNLRWGTRQENAIDRIRHEPEKRDSEYRFSRLREAQIPGIRRLKGRLSAEEVGRQYGVAGGTIRNIWLGRNWRYVPDSP